MKLIYGCILALLFSACNNSTENAAPTKVDNMVNKDTAFVPKDSIHNHAAIDSMNKDNSQQKQ
jgi:hypothetical protein